MGAAGICGTWSRTMGGSLIHIIAAAAQASRIPPNVIALLSGTLTSVLLDPE
jgi:hypothetical protein